MSTIHRLAARTADANTLELFGAETPTKSANDIPTKPCGRNHGQPRRYTHAAVYRQRSPSPRDLAWAAGFLDGDGCISMAKLRLTSSKQPRRANYAIAVSVSQSHLETIEHFRKVIGLPCQHQITKKRKGLNHDHHALHYWREHATELIRMLRPYLIRRRERADAILKYVEECRPFDRRGPKGLGPAMWTRRGLYYQLIRSLQ